MEFLSPIIKLMPLIWTFLGLFLSYIFFYKMQPKGKYKKWNNKMWIFKKRLYEFFFNAGLFNTIYNTVYLYFLHLFYEINVKNIEKGFFEWVGPVGLYLFFRNLSYKSRNLSPFFINITLLLIFLNIIYILYFIILNNIIIVQNIYFVLLLYYLIQEGNKWEGKKEKKVY
jgi:NADH:ubiquinone oxidoreductase subunit 5 (subunit L)/multisubunit Na+/H+ antiporter MnhA subunit